MAMLREIRVVPGTKGDVRRIRIVATVNGYAIFRHRRPGALGRLTPYYTLFRVMTCERVPGEHKRMKDAVAAATKGGV